MTIADVIGWKFNHQPGMCCREISGVLTIVEFPGGIPSQDQQDAWTAEYQAWVAANGLTDLECDRTIDAGKMTRLNFEVNFNQENRLRVLEGKPTITKLQYRDALKAVWRTL
jgi:hypothetical protein